MKIGYENDENLKVDLSFDSKEYLLNCVMDLLYSPKGITITLAYVGFPTALHIIS